MGFETATQGLGGTRNFYGTRDNNEGTEGSLKTFGTRQQKVLDISGKSINDNVFAVDLAFLPGGALIVSAFVQVIEVFALSDTLPTILVGTEGSEVTNGLVISEALAEALGTTDITATLTGTWAVDATGGVGATDTQISVVLGGTTPAITAAGHLRVTIEYVIIK